MSQLYLEYSFDIERFSFFQRAVLEALGEPMDFEPDILHLNDWQTGMIPCLLEAHYRPVWPAQQAANDLHDPQPQIPGDPRPRTALPT